MVVPVGARSTVGCFWLSLLYIVIVYVGFPGSAEVKNPLSMVETQEKWVQSLGREDPLEREMATHSSILVWKTSWTEDPVQSLGREYPLEESMATLQYSGLENFMDRRSCWTTVHGIKKSQTRQLCMFISSS